MNKNSLLKKIQSKDAKIGVIGMGYVGLPLAREFLEVDFSITGFDIDDKKVKSLNEGKSYIKHIDDAFITNYVRSKKLRATNDFKELQDMDVIIICVPTPMGRHFEPDLSYVNATAESIAANMRTGQLVVLESTTYPGTTREEVLPRLERGGMRVGKDFFLGFSPEREDPGNKQFSTKTITKVVSGITSECKELASALYGMSLEKIHPVSSPEVAESAKLLENIYRAINIALVNELKMVFSRMNIDIWEVIEAASTKPFGFQAFYPGPGLGGHCIPIDPFYLTWKAKEYGMHTRFIELAGEVNNSMPHYVLDNTMRSLNQAGKSIKDAKVLVMGLSYKPDIDDLRESPSLEIIELLLGENANVSFADPYFNEIPPMRKHHIAIPKVEITPETLQKFDAILISTDHSSFDYELIAEYAPLIIDTRNALHKRGIKLDRIIKS